MKFVLALVLGLALATWIAFAAVQRTTRQWFHEDIREASAAMVRALSMSSDEKRDRMRAMRAHVAEFNVYRWAGKMLMDAARLRRRATVVGRLDRDISRLASLPR